MKTDNPAVFECKGGGEQKLHRWSRLKDGRAVCLNCSITLTREQANEVWSDR